MTLLEWQENVDHWIKKFGVRYFDVTTNTLLLSEEVGELARLVARQFGEQSFKTQTSEQEIKSKLSEELGDIIFVATCLANQLDMDLEEVLQDNMRKKTSRDHKRHRENPKLT